MSVKSKHGAGGEYAPNWRPPVSVISFFTFGIVVSFLSLWMDGPEGKRVMVFCSYVGTSETGLLE